MQQFKFAGLSAVAMVFLLCFTQSDGFAEMGRNLQRDRAEMGRKLFSLLKSEPQRDRQERREDWLGSSRDGSEGREQSRARGFRRELDRQAVRQDFQHFNFDNRQRENEERREERVESRVRRVFRLNERVEGLNTRRERRFIDSLRTFRREASRNANRRNLPLVERNPSQNIGAQSDNLKNRRSLAERLESRFDQESDNRRTSRLLEKREEQRDDSENRRTFEERRESRQDREMTNRRTNQVAENRGEQRGDLQNRRTFEERRESRQNREITNQRTGRVIQEQRDDLQNRRTSENIRTGRVAEKREEQREDLQNRRTLEVQRETRQDREITNRRISQVLEKREQQRSNHRAAEERREDGQMTHRRATRASERQEEQRETSDNRILNQKRQAEARTDRKSLLNGLTNIPQTLRLAVKQENEENRRNLVGESRESRIDRETNSRNKSDRRSSQEQRSRDTERREEGGDKRQIVLQALARDDLRRIDRADERKSSNSRPFNIEYRTTRQESGDLQNSQLTDATRSIGKTDENNNQIAFERSMATSFKSNDIDYIPAMQTSLLFNAINIILVSLLITQIAFNSKGKGNWIQQHVSNFVAVTKEKVL